MTEPEFQTHMNRLVVQFGKGAYSQERVTLFWRELQSLSGEWWGRTVDSFLGECRQAPLMPEVREAASRERERIRQIQKQQESREAERFMSSYGPEDVSMIAGTIKARIHGEVNEETWKDFRSGLESVARSAKTHLMAIPGGKSEARLCGYCGDTGKIEAVSLKTQGIFVFRCVCPAGNRYPRYVQWKPEHTNQFRPEFYSASFVPSEGA